MSIFDEDTAVERLDEESWAGKVTSRWNVGSVPNGGYVLSMAGRALTQALAHPEPLTVNAFFLAKTEIGDARLLVESMRTGNKISFGSARLVQGEQEKMRVTAAYTDLGALEGPEYVESGPPDAPGPEHCIPADMLQVEFSKRFDIRYLPAYSGLLEGERMDRAEFVAWSRFRDGREPDALSLLLFADAFPPALFSRFGVTGWVPTVELTVQVRRRPVPGYLLCRFRSRYLTDGLVEEDGEIWDSGFNLVALSRQLAKFRIPETGRGGL